MTDEDSLQPGRARRPRRAAVEDAPLHTGTARTETSPYLDPPLLPQRITLGHEVPEWVATGAIFFVTVCAKHRASGPLLKEETATNLVNSVKFLHDRGNWFARLFLVMPDHIHGLLAFPSSTSITQRVSSWKSYTHKNLGVEWQERFFDHRLRSDESLDEKAQYIRLNPVRAGLVTATDQWPHVFDAFAVDGTAGTPRPTNPRPTHYA